MSEPSKLDEVFGPTRSERTLGQVLEGSLSTGLKVRLDSGFTIERLAV
jgi:hypothetical protein